MYSCGATILPVWPTCKSLGRSPHPPPRLAPMAAPSLSASGVMTSLNFSLLPRARPPETMILAAVSSGRSLLAISLPTKLLLPLSAVAAAVSNGGAATGGGCGVKAGGAHGDDLDAVAALHGGNGVAGVDGALEGVGAHDLGDVADLRDVELGATRGATFLPPAVAGTGCGCSCWRWPDLAATFSARPCSRPAASAWMTLATPAIWAAASCGGTGVVAGDQHVHVAAAGQRRDGVQGGAL